MIEFYMKRMEEIKKLYRKYSKAMNEVSSEFPIGPVPDGFGYHHLEIRDDGKMSLISTERGIETSRQETYSVDELLYWVFSGQANSKAFYKRNAAYNYEECQRIALKEIGKISDKWRQRLQKEQNNT